MIDQRPTAQLETAERLIQAAMCTGTLARNLHHERFRKEPPT